MAVGRISGPLLKDNLLRNGQNLAFETSLLYLDVVNGRVGINTASPAYDLDVNGTTRSTNLYASTQANIATFTLTSNTLSSSSSTINLLPSGVNPVVYQGSLTIGTQLNITGNTIASLGTNTDININTTGTGSININANTTVNGNLHVTGNITADGGSSGNITLGNQTTDTITFTGEVNSDILPSVTGTYNLGSNSLQWNNLYVNTANFININVNNLVATDIKTANLDISGNTISTYTPNTDINFTTSNNYGLQTGNLRFYNSTVTNIVSNAVTNIGTTPVVANFTGAIALETAVTFTGNINGTTLTITTTPTGAGIVAGYIITGNQVASGSYIVANLTGTGTSSGSTWTVYPAQVVSGTTITATPIILTVTSFTGSIPIVTGMIVADAGNAVTLGTYITALGSGSGGNGTYYVTPSQTVSSSLMTATGSGTGYTKIAGTYGIVIPNGGSSARPLQAYSELGMIRYNTDLQLVEVWTGSAWISVAGSSSGVNALQANDIGFAAAITFG